MTNGSSQGLFVVVAVIIFGIFVAISYTLFRDTLTPSLASIFKDSTDSARTPILDNKVPSLESPSWYRNYDSENNKVGDAKLVTIDNIRMIQSNFGAGAGYYYRLNTPLNSEVEVKIVAKGYGNLRFGLEGQVEDNGAKVVTLTNEFKEYRHKFKVTSENKAFIIYGSQQESSFYAYNPSLKIINE